MSEEKYRNNWRLFCFCILASNIITYTVMFYSKCESWSIWFAGIAGNLVASGLFWLLLSKKKKPTPHLNIQMDGEFIDASMRVPNTDNTWKAMTRIRTSVASGNEASYILNEAKDKQVDA